MKTVLDGYVHAIGVAASTVFSPEILIIDEVLGVGDAYFAYKSFEHIGQCARNRVRHCFS